MAQVNPDLPCGSVAIGDRAFFSQQRGRRARRAGYRWPQSPKRTVIDWRIHWRRLARRLRGPVDSPRERRGHSCSPCAAPLRWTWCSGSGQTPATSLCTWEIP